MIITPARFEDEMYKIVRSGKSKVEQSLDAIALMIDTLESMGYERGIAVFKEDEK